jgi:predicted O-linked N-acetylglucosamine transferase (SPINDLY family)
MRQRLKRSFDRFVDTRQQSDQEIAELVRKLEIDIAIDLKGFTQDARTGIITKRPAPIQVSYIGYPGTMGTEYIDYIIGDRFVIPEDQHQSYSEKVVYLPDSYQVNDATRHISETKLTRSDAGLPESGFVFCSFNNSFKITPDVFDVWMMLLHQVDGSALWLLEGNSSCAMNLKLEAIRRGVSPERLIFAPKIKLEDHLARHRLADLFLDTIYYNAHTTASDALWAGLPLVTCSGETFAARVAGSLLNAIGLPELVTKSLEEYEALALKLALDPVLLASLKEKLARNRDTYPLFNTARFTRHIETAYITMWERYQRGEPPASFAVDPID